MGFAENTRQNLRLLARQPYVAGAGQSAFQLSQVGILARIHVHVSGIMTITPGTGTATLSEKAPWNTLRRVRFQVGNGTELVNVSGHGAYLVDLQSRLGYEPEDGQIGAAHASEVFNCPVASGANAWEFGFTVPIVPNERDTMGMILLQAQQTVTQLLLEWQVAGGPTFDYPVVLTGNATASFAGDADVYLETFTAPANIADYPQMNMIHQILETSQPIAGTGDQVVKLLEENMYLRVIHAVEVNGALTNTAVEELQFRYNITDVPYRIGRKMYHQLKRRQYTKDFPRGVFIHDFFDQGYPNFGGDRDIVAASGLAELESLITIASGTVLGSGNNQLRTIQQNLVPVNIPNMVAR